MNDFCTASSDSLDRHCGRVGDRSNERGVVHAPGRSRLRAGHAPQVIRVNAWSEDWMGDQRLDARFDARTPDHSRARVHDRRVFGRGLGTLLLGELTLLHRSSESHPHGEAFGPGAQCHCAECANDAIGGTSSRLVYASALHHQILDPGSDRAC